MDVAPWIGRMPGIPASRVDPVAEPDAILLWAQHGSVTVRLPDGRELVASSGEAIWVPPGVRHTAELAAGSVAVPILVETTEPAAPLDRPRVFAVPPAWHDWLIYRVARTFGFTHGGRPDRPHLLELLREVVPRDAGDLVPPLPPMPRSPGPRAVVRALLRDPAATDGAVALAAAGLISPRTLQRRLRQETGHSLGQWRTAIRITAAAGHLMNGYDLAWTAHRVGYRSTSGFAHAFADRVGVSPGRFLEAHARSTATVGATGNEAPTDQAAPPPSIPAAPPATWVTAVDSVLWVYRGTLTVQDGGIRREVSAGDVLCLRRGAPHQVTIAADSIVLPLGWQVSTGTFGPDSRDVIRLPRTADTERFLLHTVISNHYLLRPPAHDDQQFLGVLRPGVRPEPSRIPAGVDAIVSTLTQDPSDARTLTEWAVTLGVREDRLRREFVTATGASLPRWRAQTRMTEARALLGEGHPPSVVARRVGYAHLSAFSRAFAAAHGMPPRHWIADDPAADPALAPAEPQTRPFPRETAS